MEEKDFIFEEVEGTELKEDDSGLSGDYSAGDTVLVNGLSFTITEFVKAKKVGDNLGFPGIYSWYRAKDDEEKTTNLFFFDDDLDCQEENDLTAKKWFETYGEE